MSAALEMMVTAALMALPVACFWAAWELRGIRERVGGIQQALAETGQIAKSALVRADTANRRIDVLDRLFEVSSRGNVFVHQRRERDIKP